MKRLPFLLTALCSVLPVALFASPDSSASGRPVTMLDALPILFSRTANAADTLPRKGTLGASFGPVSEDVRAANSLQPGVGLVVTTVAAGLTADKAGLKAGDVLISLNGTEAGPGRLGAVIRDLKTGQEITFVVLRNKESKTLKANYTEKPRDPGNSNYDVIYSHVVSNGARMRTIITLPKKPGRHPVLFFIQGFSPISYDFTLETATGDVNSLDGPILFEFANSNYVTVRVEKPGVGDSEGGPFETMDFTTELDIYRQAMKQTMEHPAVDKDNVFIFGHSMGGSFGPVVASEFPVKGLAIYGSAMRTWFEYMLDITRYQGLLAGRSAADTDEMMRISARLFALVFFEKMSVEDIKAKYPELASEAQQTFPNNTFSGKTLAFWRELNDTNFPRYLAQMKGHVLAVRGQSDFVTYDLCHQLMADTVNAARPGYGRFVSLPNSDHLFHTWATEKEAQVGYSRGKFNPAFTKLMMSWTKEIMSR
ncbi:MAG: alpha/beta fold hydrolase [Armatimonadetes bacterium]|nr:alpha/beta fold hydrolase [Armatimonadota bacterium]